MSTDWRTGYADQAPSVSSAWLDTYSTADVLCPWTVRRYADESSVDEFFSRVVKEDVQLARERNTEYALTVFPGFSVRSE